MNRCAEFTRKFFLFSFVFVFTLFPIPYSLFPITPLHAAELNLTETRLAAIPEDYQWREIIFSANGKQVAYKARKGDKEFVVVGNKAGKFYEAINDPLVLSPDGKKVAYDGKRGGKEYLVIDGKEVNSYDNVDPSAFSPDSRLLACEMEDKEKWFIVVYDGEKEVYRSPAYPRSLRTPLFSPDGRLFVYELGDDNNRIVFFLDLLTKKIIKERLYADFALAGKISFSSDYSRVIYEAGKEGKYSAFLLDLVLNEERKIELPYTWTGMSALSPDGKKIAYIAIKEGKHFLVVSPWKSPAQGKESGPYEAVIPAIFSPDSRLIAYQAMKEGKWRVVVGDKEGRGYDGVGDALVFSPDSAKLAYPAVKDGKWVMVFSPVGKPTAVKEGPAYDMVVTPVFSPDGKYIAFRARTGTMEKAKRFIVIADAETGKVIKEGHVSDEVWPPVFSADGKSVAYGARIERELWWKVQTLP